MVESLWIEGNKSDGIVKICDLTIKGGEKSGLRADDGMNVIMRGISVEKNGLYAFNGMNVIMRGFSIDECQGCGVIAYGADITFNVWCRMWKDDAGWSWSDD